MTAGDVVERLVASQREHGGGFAEALARLEDAWFHVVLDWAQSARADQDDGQAAVATLARASLALDPAVDPAALTAAQVAGAFFDVLDAIQHEQQRRSRPSHG
jgi:hypothetical protein